MVPETIGRLRRIRRLGSGAFATVWLYHDDELDSDVAVKALADNWVDRLDVVERFLREARLLRAAGSEHVVEVYDIGETTDGTPYFVMSHADLGTVADLAERERLDPGTVADLVRQAARGLSDLHATGVIHRDVKPQNLLLRSDRRLGRRVLVTDLGLAKELAFASGLTRVVGSPGYQAPEQGRLGARLDERVDVYG
ncbi:MAG TPA: serine/threonine-protein kinase, partial [Microlunatus sp.]|nr:serine/threonine-protein kinase [Microlunatus sp.]